MNATSKAIEIQSPNLHQLASLLKQPISGVAGRRLSILMAASLLTALMGCRDKPTASPSLPNKPATTTPPALSFAKLELEPFVMPRVKNPGYVGPQACGECHRDRVEECLSSSHFRTCRVPNSKTMPRGFKIGDNSLELPDCEVRFEMTERDGVFFQTAVNQANRSVPPVQSTIDLILGAGKSSDEVYLSWHPDNTLWELPVAWVYANDCWGASGFDRNSSGDHARALTVRCFECHNTWFEHVPGTVAEYQREELILGVTCERCHGPGKEHVDFHREHPAEKMSHGILLPSSLPRERLIEVCTQCHGNAIRHRGPALSYRPGQPLEEHYRFVDPPHTEDDHVANQIEYMRQSKCFQKSEMTCITCHDPHLTDQPAEGESFLSNCIGCHQREHCGKQADLPMGVRDHCTECHMRKYVKINVNFDLADDSYVPPTRRSQHRIEVDNFATQETLLAWHRSQSSEEDAKQAAMIAEQLVNDWLIEAAKIASDSRYRGAIAAVREALGVLPDSAEAKLKLAEYIAIQKKLDEEFTAAEHLAGMNRDTEAKVLLERLLSVQSRNADATGRLGKLLAKQGDKAGARVLLEKVQQLNPDDQYGLSLLAWIAMSEGDYARAAELYRQADSLEPFNAKIQSLWAEALARDGKLTEAIDHYQVSLRINPRLKEALQGLVIVYSQKQQFALAVPYAKQLVQLTEYQDVAHLMNWADLHTKIGQRAEAQKIVTHALEVSKKLAPNLESDIRQWAVENQMRF